MKRGLIAFALVSCGHDKAPGAELTTDEISIACATAAACVHEDPAMPPRSVADNLILVDLPDSYLSIFRPENIRCLVAAHGDCATARACVGFTESACSADTFTCHGSSTYKCTNGLAVEFDCGPEATCITNAVGLPTCGQATCTSDALPCDGTKQLTCSNNVSLVDDCAEQGATCVADGSGQGRCAPISPCPNANACDGSAACSPAHIPRACDQLLAGGTCVEQTLASVTIATCGFASECDVTTPPVCSGNVLSLCTLGKTATIDCVAAGFSGCGAGACTL
jgi:hypothetical protein